MAIGTSGYMESIHFKQAPIKPSEDLYRWQQLGNLASLVGSVANLTQQLNKPSAQEIASSRNEYDRGINGINSQYTDPIERARQLDMYHQSVQKGMYNDNPQMFEALSNYMYQPVKLAQAEAAKQVAENSIIGIGNGLATDYVSNPVALTDVKAMMSEQSGGHDLNRISTQFNSSVYSQLSQREIDAAKLGDARIMQAEFARSDKLISEMDKDVIFGGSSSAKQLNQYTATKSAYLTKRAAVTKMVADGLEDSVLSQISVGTTPKGKAVYSFKPGMDSNLIENNINQLKVLGETDKANTLQGYYNKASSLQKALDDARTLGLNNAENVFELDISRYSAVEKEVVEAQRNKVVADSLLDAHSKGDIAKVTRIVTANPKELEALKEVNDKLVLATNTREELKQRMGIVSKYGLNGSANLMSPDTQNYLIKLDTIADYFPDKSIQEIKETLASNKGLELDKAQGKIVEGLRQTANKELPPAVANRFNKTVRDVMLATKSEEAVKDFYTKMKDSLQDVGNTLYYNPLGGEISPKADLNLFLTMAAERKGVDADEIGNSYYIDRNSVGEFQLIPKEGFGRKAAFSMSEAELFDYTLLEKDLNTIEDIFYRLELDPDAQESISAAKAAGQTTTEIANGLIDRVTGGAFAIAGMPGDVEEVAPLIESMSKLLPQYNTIDKAKEYLKYGGILGQRAANAIIDAYAEEYSQTVLPFLEGLTGADFSDSKEYLTGVMDNAAIRAEELVTAQNELKVFATYDELINTKRAATNKIAESYMDKIMSSGATPELAAEGLKYYEDKLQSLKTMKSQGIPRDIFGVQEKKLEDNIIKLKELSNGANTSASGFQFISLAQASDVVPEGTQTIAPMNSTETSFVSMLKTEENSIKAGYNKNTDKWLPHTSPEGGTDTIAYGHKLSSKEDSSGIIDINGKKVNYKAGLTPEQAEMLLVQDMANSEKKAQKYFTKAEWNKMPRKVQLLATELEFNVRKGLKGYPTFVKLAKNPATVEDAITEIGRTYTDEQGNKVSLSKRVGAITDWYKNN
jgi:hypothetical protein